MRLSTDKSAERQSILVDVPISPLDSLPMLIDTAIHTTVTPFSGSTNLRTVFFFEDVFRDIDFDPVDIEARFQEVEFEHLHCIDQHGSGV